MECVLIINALQMRRSVIIFTLVGRQPGGGRQGAHMSPSTLDCVAASRWGRWPSSPGWLVSCHPCLGACLGLISASSLTQQAAALQASARHTVTSRVKLRCQPSFPQPPTPHGHSDHGPVSGFSCPSGRSLGKGCLGCFFFLLETLTRKNTEKCTT